MPVSFERRDSSSLSPQPFVSVIVPVYNDPDRLALCLQALEKQSYPSQQYEVVVIDNGSSESPRSVVDQYAHARLAREDQPGSYAARNRGLELAKGEFLAFTDADCIPDRNWLEKGIAALIALPSLGLIAGDVRLFFKDPKRPRAAELYDMVTAFKVEDRARNRKFAYTASSFTHRSTFDRIGLFNAELKSRGDMEWGQRVALGGLPVDFCGEAFVLHPTRDSVGDILRKMRRLKGGQLDVGGVQDHFAQQVTTNMPWWMKALPSLSVLKKDGGDHRLVGWSQRAKVVALGVLVHYCNGLERLRLALGGKSERR